MRKMCEDTSIPNTQTFVAMLRACAKLKDAGRGCEIHVDIARLELDRNPYVGCALVHMYANGGLLSEAQEVFDRLYLKDIFCWNALVAGYAKHGCGEEALDCVEQMQEHGIDPNSVTYLSILKACGAIGAADKGQELHVEIARKGLLKRHHYVGNALVGMYAKCKLLAKACEVCDGLLVRDAISWNVLIDGYASKGFVMEAFNCFQRMGLDGVSPDTMTFMSILKACRSIRSASIGQNMHAEIARRVFLDGNSVVGGALVDMYAAVGMLEQAREVLHAYSLRDIITWTTVITSCVRHGCCEEALKCFEEMQHANVAQNAVTLISTLKACSNVRALAMGEEIHAEIERQGLLEESLEVGNALLDMYANCGYLVKLKEVFDKLSHRDVVSWTTLISGHTTTSDHAEGALIFFKQMQVEGFHPDAVTFSCALKACAMTGAAKEGINIHKEVSRQELLERDLVVGNAVIGMYASCGMLQTAQEVLHGLKSRDVVSWTTLISGYVKRGYHDKALDYFEQMQDNTICPDAILFVCGLQACGSIGAASKGQQLHAMIVEKKLLESNLVVGNALVDMYAKCGMLAKGQELLHKLPSRDEVSWNALMAGHAQFGDLDTLCHCLDQMVEESIRPNAVTLICALNACSHAGLVEAAKRCAKVMTKEHVVIPILEHYICIMDLLGRAGQLSKMAAWIEEMPFHPNLVVWHSLLSACSKSGDSDIGRHAFEHSMALDGTDAASFVCMSNICAGLAQYSNLHS